MAFSSERWSSWSQLVARPKVRLGVTVALTVIFFGLGLSYLRKVDKGKSALVRWLPQIEELQEGDNIFRFEAEGGHEFPHPPFAALHLYPYTVLPLHVAGALWFVLRALAYAIALKLIFDTVAERGRPMDAFARLVVVFLTFRTAASDLQHGNINLFILFWCALSLWGFKHRRDWLAGLAVAVGISLKVTPALLLVYFLYKRAWKVGAWAAVGLLACNVALPALVLGASETWVYSKTWFDVMVRTHMIEGQIEVDFRNQSLQAVLLRFLSDVAKDGYSQPAILHLPMETARWIIRGALVALLALLAWLCRGRATSRDSFFRALEYGVVLLGMLYFNERSWKHHYVIAALPYAAFLYAIRQQAGAPSGRRLLGKRLWIGALVVSTAIVWISSSGVIGHRLSDMVEWYGSMFFSSLILFVGMAVLLLRAKRRGWETLDAALGQSAATSDAPPEEGKVSP